jgi:hypothetical protein
MFILSLGVMPPWICGVAWAGEPRIDVRLNHSAVTVGSSVVLTIELEGFSGKAKPTIPTPDGFDIYESGRSTNISLVNGRFSKSTVLTYQLVARKEGTYAIGPITVADKGRSYEAESLTIRVSPRSGSSSSRQTARGQTPQVERDARDAGDKGLFARVEVDKREAFLDEQITLRFKLFRRADVALVGTRNFEPPTCEGFWREDLGPERSYAVEIDGETYGVTELAWAIFPTREGEWEIGPSGIVCYVEERTERRRRDPFSDFFDRGFFGRGFSSQRPVQLRTNPVRVRVGPLPDAGCPTGFTGSVGDYSISAAFDVEEARQGEPLALSATIRGTGHIQTIGFPVWPDWNGLRVYDSGDAVSLEKKNDLIVGEKTFTQVLVPTRTGELRIEPIRFVFFDPDEESYKTISTAPLQIHISAPAISAAGTGSGGIVPLGEEILYIRTDLLGSLERERQSRFSWPWLLHLIPVLAVAVAVWIRKRRDVLESDPALARRSQACRAAINRLGTIDPHRPSVEMARALADLLEAYLSDWLDREVRGMRRSELRGALLDAAAGPELVARAMSLLAWSDEVRFGSGSCKDAAAQHKALSDLIRDLETVFRRSAFGRRL